MALHIEMRTGLPQRVCVPLAFRKRIRKSQRSSIGCFQETIARSSFCSGMVLGSLMRYFLLILALGWLALMPPFFTHGACDAEFDQEATEVASNHETFRSPELARSYWESKAVSVSVLSADQCRHRILKFVDSCGSGLLVYAAVPVKNRICRLYRDESITVQFGYNEHGRLERVETDMKPFKSLKLPFIGKTLYWAK